MTPILCASAALGRHVGLIRLEHDRCGSGGSRRVDRHVDRKVGVEHSVEDGGVSDAHDEARAA